MSKISRIPTLIDRWSRLVASGLDVDSAWREACVGWCGTEASRRQAEGLVIALVCRQAVGLGLAGES